MSGRARLPLRRLLTVLPWLALGLGAGLLWPAVRPDPLNPLADAAVAGVAAGSVKVEVGEGPGRYLDIAPSDGGADLLLILYPGGAVTPEAYVWLGVALAAAGVRTVIPEMPFDLAVLALRRAAALREALSPGSERVVVAGHSLGGTMAARYALGAASDLDGLILMGAFSAGTDDLSALPLEVLVLAAERDGLATLAEVQAGLVRLPPTTELVVVDGAAHSFFGRYGPQPGDGTPWVDRAAAEAQIVAALRRFLARLEPS